MIIAMKTSCSQAEVQRVLEFLSNHNLEGTVLNGAERVVIGVFGSTGSSTERGVISPAIINSLEGLVGVESATRISKPYKLASREFHPLNTVVTVPAPCAPGGVVNIGSNAVV